MLVYAMSSRGLNAMTIETYEIISAGILTLFSAAIVLVKLSNRHDDTSVIQNIKEVVSFILKVKK